MSRGPEKYFGTPWAPAPRSTLFTLIGHCNINVHRPRGVSRFQRFNRFCVKCFEESAYNSLLKMSGNGEGNKERTFLMLKPDAVHRGLIADIIKRFEQKGFKLVAMKFVKV